MKDPFDKKAMGIEDLLFQWTEDSKESSCAWPSTKIREVIASALRDADRRGRYEVREMAANACCTSSSGDCCHETADRNAEAIRRIPVTPANEGTGHFRKILILLNGSPEDHLAYCESHGLLDKSDPEWKVDSGWRRFIIRSALALPVTPAKEEK